MRLAAAKPMAKKVAPRGKSVRGPKRSMRFPVTMAKSPWITIAREKAPAVSPRPQPYSFRMAT